MTLKRVKPIIVFFICIFLVLAIFFVFLLNGTNPQSKLIGAWEEVEWIYEKSEVSKNTKNKRIIVESGMRAEIMKNRIIHESEFWTFHKNNILHLVSSRQNNSKLKWQLKGRGHVLQLIHSNGSTETFNIQELSKNRMVLYFEFDLQIKGGVKMIFKRKKDAE